MWALERLAKLGFPSITEIIGPPKPDAKKPCKLILGFHHILA
jgi:hypothetical protein